MEQKRGKREINGNIVLLRANATISVILNFVTTYNTSSGKMKMCYGISVSKS